MAQSPSSAERRAHLIREMAKQSEHGRNRSSAPSSIASGRASPRAFDTESQQLPALPPHPSTDPVKMRADPGFHINTSALRRAFPDFSQYGSSDEDSIELGRGGHNSIRSSPSKQALSEDVTKDLSFEIGDGHRYRITATPPAKPRRNVAESNAGAYKVPEISGKENHDPAPAKTTTYGSGSSSPADHYSRPGREPLAELNAQVDTDNSLLLNAGQNQPLAEGKRSSRFAKNVHARINTTPKGKGLESVIQNGTVTSAQSAANGTYQSFLLPDLPNITELVSGVRQDGTPLFHSTTKSKSRFSTPLRQRSQQLPAYMPLGNTPIPADEKALYASLQLLQEKVANLEKEKAAADKRADDYELELLQLRSKVEEQVTQFEITKDLAQGADDTKTKDWDLEKSKFEQSMKTLQARLNKANKKVSACEVTIQNLTKDRDAAHQQLAVAYLNSEELKNEADGVRDEIDKVKSQLAKVTKRHEKKIERLTKEESELRAKIQRREKAVNEMSALTKDLWETRRVLEASANAYITVEDTRGVQGPTLTRRTCTSRPKSTSGASGLGRSTSQPNVNKQPTSSAHDAAATRTSHHRSLSNAENIELAMQPMNEDLSKDSDFLSFMDGDEVAKLRNIVEQDKDRLSRLNLGDNTNDATRRENIAPIKSALKTASAPSRSQIIRDDDPLTQDLTTGQDSTRETTGRRLASRRRSNFTDNFSNADMTSAIILPDITLHSELASVLDAGTKELPEKVFIPRPVPVSDRLPAHSELDDESTTRPAQPPAIALATVLKGLEDEVTRLKKQLSQLEKLYNRHDPSLSKRRRKSVYEKMQRCLVLLELKADQIYALYDVLEGQKATGQTMKEEEVEVTLRGIGIDMAAAKANASDHASLLNASQLHEPGAASDGEDEDDDDLPWEGIETTGTQTIGSVRNAF